MYEDPPIKKEAPAIPQPLPEHPAKEEEVVILPPDEGTIPEEDPYENASPYEPTEPGEGP